MQEIWKPIDGYEGKYEVSNLGCVRSMLSNKNLAFEKTDKGYFRVGLYKDGKTKKFRVHRLVASAFVPNPENFPEVNHKDGIKSNNAAHNLEWCSPCKNAIHAFKNGLRKGKCHLEEPERE